MFMKIHRLPEKPETIKGESSFHVQSFTLLLLLPGHPALLRIFLSFSSQAGLICWHFLLCPVPSGWCVQCASNPPVFRPQARREDSFSNGCRRRSSSSDKCLLGCVSPDNKWRLSIIKNRFCWSYRFWYLGTPHAQWFQRSESVMRHHQDTEAGLRLPDKSSPLPHTRLSSLRSKWFCLGSSKDTINLKLWTRHSPRLPCFNRPPDHGNSLRFFLIK